MYVRENHFNYIIKKIFLYDNILCKNLHPFDNAL
jgi:hypothetical protein